MKKKPKTIKVRIACAVDIDGDWSARGWKNASNSQMTNDVTSDIWHPNGLKVHWIEAEVPVPERTTIKGEVNE